MDFQQLIIKRDLQQKLFLKYLAPQLFPRKTREEKFVLETKVLLV